MPRRFLVIGLPRSGTTYLSTMLNSHPEILCAGEQFNPFQIVGLDDDPIILDYQSIARRDSAPWQHAVQFFDSDQHRGYACVGFKYMLGHNIQVLRKLETEPDIALIFVWRRNRLAQISSLIKAHETRRWAQTREDAHVARKIETLPRDISHRWHEYATFDHLFQQWLHRQPHASLTLEYRDLFQPGFEDRISTFLGVDPHPDMKSPLVKQGANTILDRFKDPEQIERYFRSIGYAHWLEPEL